MRYMQSFPDSGAVQTAISNQELGRPYVAVYQQTVDFNGYAPGPGPGPDGPCSYINQYLTFKILDTSNGDSIGWHNDRGNDVLEIEYEINGSGIWNTLGGQGAGDTVYITGLTEGDVVRFRGTNQIYGDDFDYGMNRFEGSAARYEVYGNIMSLIYGDNFVGQYEFPSGTYLNLATMLEQDDCVVTEKLVLPVTAATEGCYAAMFGTGASVEGLTCLMDPNAIDQDWDIPWNLRMIQNPQSDGTMYCLDTNISSEFNDPDLVNDYAWQFENYPCNLTEPEE